MQPQPDYYPCLERVVAKRHEVTASLKARMAQLGIELVDPSP